MLQESHRLRELAYQALRQCLPVARMPPGCLQAGHARQNGQLTKDP